MSNVAEAHVQAVRRFNRFYTQTIGLLRDGLNATPYSLGEARLIYELAHRREASATELCRALALDAGFMSRLLTKLERAGLVARRPSPDDARRLLVSLTATGRDAFARLDDAASADVSALLAPLDAAQREEAAGAMATLTRLFGGGTGAAPIVLRPHRTGDIGYIAHRQGLLYAQEYGWDQTYEALAAEILAGFVRNFDPRHEGAWIAEREGKIIGSVFLVRKAPATGQLRLLYVEPSARGLGVGRALVEQCVGAAREKGYQELVLWTQDCLASARQLYQSAGFVLSQEERHHAFGHDLNGQMWSLDLRRTSRA